MSEPPDDNDDELLPDFNAADDGAGTELVEVFDPAFRAHRMRLAGTSWEEIALALDYPSTAKAKLAVRTYLQRAAAAAEAEQLSEVLDLELSRLDALQVAYWQKAIDGDVNSAKTVLDVMRQRSRLLGLEDRPEQEKGAKTIVIAGSHDEYVQSLEAVYRATTQAGEG